MKRLTAVLLLAATVAVRAQTPVANTQLVQPAPIQTSTAASQASMTQLLNDMAVRQAAQNAAAVNQLQLLQRPVVVVVPKSTVKSAK